jgi:hypothetical protein
VDGLTCSALREGIKKANPREAHNQDRTKTCTTIVMLPSPRSLFFSIERRLNYLYLSVVRQRNQSRLKHTFTTLIQSESIRQPDADVNSLLVYTRPSTGLIEGLLQLLFKYCCSSLIDLLSVSCAISCRLLEGCAQQVRWKAIKIPSFDIKQSSVWKFTEGDNFEIAALPPVDRNSNDPFDGLAVFRQY